MRNSRFALVFLCLASAAFAAVHPEAANVLILVNDAVPPEPGTGGKGASVFVGEYYAQQRGVPASQILHLNFQMGCCNDVRSWDGWNTNWEWFDFTIRQPLLKFLADNNLTNQINYIVPVYGIPLRTWNSTHTVEGLSVDSFLATINSGQITQFVMNPYWAPWNQSKPHVRNFQNSYGWKMYIVSRVDGPTVQIATGLVDKAIRAEVSLKTTDGVGYFDYRNLGTGNGAYYSADQTMVNANKLARDRGYATVFNDQSVSGDMIHSAPRALWAWGWYSGMSTWDGYEFVEGAVGAQLTSYTANSIRGLAPGAWVPLWLNAGITATWGATTEPYTAGYANGDNLLNKFWSGYNFGESAFQAVPYLNHAMVFVGDPLYAPQVFQTGQVAVTSFVCQATTLVANASTQCNITLSKTGVGTTISVSSSIPEVMVPNAVTAASDSTTISFYAYAGAVNADRSGTLSASLNGSTVSVPISVVTGLKISSLACQATSLATNTSTPCTVTLSKAAPTGAAIVLSSNSPLLTVPANVQVAANTSSISFTASAGAVSADQSATVGASLNGNTMSAPLSLVAASRVTSVACQATSLTANANTQCTVTVSKASATGTAVALSSNSPLLTVPGSVTIPASSTSVTFTATAGAVTADQSATVGATLNGATMSAPISLVATLRMTSLVCQAVSLAPNASTTCTVTLSRAAALDAVVALSSDCAALSVPTQVTVPAGASSATFTASITISPYPTTVATIAANFSGSSASTHLTVAGTGGAATFVKTDTTTLGSWRGVYGGDGYSIMNSATSLPAYVTLAPTGNSSWTWAASSTNSRAMQKPAPATDRLAACWYASGVFSFDLKFTDQGTHQVALYFLDWEPLGRVNRVEILDAGKNLLDTRTVANFGGGQYLVWNLSGTITVRITCAGTQNAVLSGIFFGGQPSATPATGTASFLRTDAATSGSWRTAYGADGFNIAGDAVSLPSSATLTPSGSTAWTWAPSTTDARGLQKSASPTDRVAASWYATNNFSLDLQFSDQAAHQVAIYLLDWERLGRSARVEIYDANNTLLDGRTVSSFDGGQYLVWNLSGRVSIRVTSTCSSSAVVSGVFFGGKPPDIPGSGGGAGAVGFLRTDTTTQGSWKGVYGADGYNVFAGSASTPSYVKVTPSGNSAWTWTPNTSDVRALQTSPATTDRIAACWYSLGAVSLDVQFTDQATHQVALYFVDWDRFHRTSRVEILDATNKVIDTRSIAEFGQGQYLVWNLSGHVTIRITNTGPLNAVLSGIFFR